MNINTKQLVPMTDANQNFSKVTRMVDDEGMAVILKNNRPRYVVMSFSEYDQLVAGREGRSAAISAAAEKILAENMKALQELAK